MIRLRPHHALCIQFFSGKGYSAAFTETMRRICALPGDTKIEIHNGADDLCACCPNRRGVTCITEEKVRRYDGAVQKICGFTPGMVLTMQDFLAQAERQIIQAGKMPCGDCCWAVLCFTPGTAKKR